MDYLKKLISNIWAQGYGTDSQTCHNPGLQNTAKKKSTTKHFSLWKTVLLPQVASVGIDLHVKHTTEWEKGTGEGV